MVFMDALCTTRCEACEQEVSSGQTPGYKLCEECSEEFGMCPQCKDYLE